MALGHLAALSALVTIESTSILFYISLVTAGLLLDCPN